MATSNDSNVQQAIKKLRWLHKVGRESLRKRPGRAKHGDRAIDEEAAELGINPDTLRKARVFADPVEGYSREELKELCDLCAQNAYPLGLRQFIRLLSVHPKKRRAKFLQEAIQAEWSTARLEAAIKKRFGTRRQGGRQPYIPTDSEDVYAQLEGFCERWRRWYRKFEQPPEHGKPERASLLDLPWSMREKVVKASKALRTLQEAVSRELQRVEPGREKRPAD